MAKKNKIKKENVSIEYVITKEMNDLISALKKCGYSTEIYSGKFYCRDNKGNYYRYCTKIIIDMYDSDGEPIDFLFDPKGNRIIDYKFNNAYCIRI